MNTSKLIEFETRKKYSHSYLTKLLGSDLKEAIEEGYFIHVEDVDSERIYIFTQKGKDAAWQKK